LKCLRAAETGGVLPNKRIKNGLKYAATFAVLVMFPTGCQSPPEGDVDARVGDVKLTRTDVESRIPVQLSGQVEPQDRRRIVERWVEEELLYQEALRRKIDQDPAVNTRISRAVRELVIIELLERAFRADADVSDEEIQVYYEAQPEDFIRDKPEIRVRHILVKSKSDLDRVRKRLRAGELFDQVAREESVDVSAISGGDLGYFTEDMVDMAFWEACKNGKLGRQIRTATPLGRHIIEVLDRREAGATKDLTEVWSEIRQRILTERRQAKRLELLVDLRNRISWSIEPDLQSKD
jgi:parvulin-like peptidyl-prolyl isomerase